MGKFKCQALVLLVPANFQAPRPARVTLFPALSGSRIFCSCPAGVWLERQARVRLLSGWTFSYGLVLSFQGPHPTLAKVKFSTHGKAFRIKCPTPQHGKIIVRCLESPRGRGRGGLKCQIDSHAYLDYMYVTTVTVWSQKHTKIDKKNLSHSLN